MAIRVPEPVAAAALEVAPAAGADVLGVEADDDDELDEHPAISAAAAASATPPAAMRARSNLDMVLTAPFKRGPSSRSTLIFARLG